MHIKLTAGQSVFLHGWLHPKPSLRWEDVTEKQSITFARCKDAGLSLKQLFQLQPNITEWVRFGAVRLSDTAEMWDLWQFHPFRDLRADLADILSLRWSCELLRKMGVSYNELVEQGMVPETMRMFSFTLLGWINIGFRAEHLKAFSDPQIVAVFGMTRQGAERHFLDSEIQH